MNLSLDPAQDALAPCIHKTEKKNADEDTHFHKSEYGIALELSSPRKMNTASTSKMTKRSAKT
jgi:hypothetical protein